MAQGQFLIGSLVAAFLVGCRALPHGAECWSLDGRPLVSPPTEPVALAQREAELEHARAQWFVGEQDHNAAIWYARRLGYLGRYREAVDVLTKALDDHPGDPFLLRHRGHRWLTLREFGKAERDFVLATDALRNTPDEVEPDGQPTPGRPPHSSLHYNVHYHLGLVQFLLGDWWLAEHAWLCCLAVVDDDESRVAVTHWLWCVRMRMGDLAGAAAVVAPISPQMDIKENKSYHQLCLLYAGKLTRELIAPLAGSAGSALAFGLAHHRLLTGDREQARRELLELSRQPAWSAFGVIAAEVELARFRR